MPSVAAKRPALEELSSYFPLTFPIATPTTHPDLISTNDLHREEDLLRNPHSFRAWWAAINTTRENYIVLSKKDLGTPNIPEDVQAVLGPLASPLARLTLQRLTYIYEAALTQFPNSFKLWKSYLTMRVSFVLGKQVVKKRAGGKKKFPEMKEALEEALEDMEEWETPLDPIVGWEEWRSLIATFECALMWLPKLPRLWLMYMSVFFHPRCPSIISFTHARRTFDRALRTLPPSLHARIWTQYLLWAERKGGEITVAVYRRYLKVDPSLTERFTDLLLNPSNSPPRPLEAAKLLLSLARKAARRDYTSPEGKSPYQLLEDWIEVVERFSEEVGLDVDETDASNNAIAKEDAEKQPDNAAVVSSPDGQLIRLAGPAVPVTADGKKSEPYTEDEDPTNSKKLNIENIVQKDGLAVYTDQAGRLWTGLATYWIKRGEFDRAKDVSEKGLKSVLTLRDFTQIFDTYVEFLESLISAMMQALEDEDEDEEDTAETEASLDLRMQELENLTDRRPFLSNDVMLRRNPNDVQEWDKRVALWGEDDDQVIKTYTKALETVNPVKQHRISIGSMSTLPNSGKGTKVNFKAVDDLAEIWCEWAEMELRHDNYDEAARVMQRATATPKNTKVNYHDHSLPVQARLFKSLKLDPGNFALQMPKSLSITAAFLEEHEYFEECFKVYERGVELFTFPVSFEIWNIYLSKFVKRYRYRAGSKLERARDLFEQALEKCPSKSSKPLFLMYAQLEEDYGLAKRSMAIYERATQVVADEDKFEMFSIYIAKATANFGLPATRPIYERALEVLPDRQTAEISADPRVNPQFWTEWNTFEIETGSEDTFREMLRIKRSTRRKERGRNCHGGPGCYAAAEQQAHKATNGPAFVSSTKKAADDQNGAPVAPAANADEIQISDEEDM
ncbi:spliceosome complex protein [Gymnopilus junonius]|uniref:Spliceosome complex protein n=1 Tax=Gymnopilus junonius TaxID=109634 RepID=A0A9P5NR11_GYMJU|nr:spliceosome complex protein [Gymnopilus junonius]